MKFYYVGFLASLIALATHVAALRLDVHGHRKHQSPRITRRGPGVRATSSELNNTADVSYYVDLKLGGKPYQVLLDTGRCVGSSYTSNTFSSFLLNMPALPVPTFGWQETFLTVT
jgi:hypothetical protein